MTPDSYSILAYILERLGTSPILIFLAIMGLGPWIATIWVNHRQDKRMGKLVDLFTKQMADSEHRYENNVQLVKNYEAFTESSQKINDDLQNLVILTTSTMQTLVDHIKNNLFCPFMRPPERADAAKEKTS